MQTKPSEVFTSTGIKYFHHPEMIEGIQTGLAKPVSLQVSPTNKCNIRCMFCSVDERTLSLEWELEDLKTAILMFVGLGIKTVEFSGGGDPTLYKHLPEIVEYCKKFDLKLGMITNGILLKDLPRKTLRAFEWIRVSIVTLDYKENLDLPKPWPKETVLGMSYVVGQINYTEKGRRFTANDYEGLIKARNFAIVNGAKYVRVVPECLTGSVDKMSDIHHEWIPVVEELGAPLFFQDHKWQKQASCCYIDMVKPWLHSDGYLYPCNSVSLNTKANRDFNEKWRLCHWKDIRKYYDNRGKGSLDFVREICDQCSFTENNKILEDLANPLPMEDFV